MTRFLSGYRCREPAETLDTFSSLLSWCGAQLGDATWLAPLGFPVAVAAASRASARCCTLGAGASHTDALVSAAGTILELWHAEHAVPPASVTASPAEALAAGYQIAGVPAHRSTQETASAELDWVEGWTVASHRRALAPRELVILGPRHHERDRSLVASRQGLAIGNTRAEAITHALLELIGREAAASASPADLTRVLLHLGTVPASWATEAICPIRCAGGHVEVTAIPNRYGVPCFAASLETAGANYHGTAAHCDPSLALPRALIKASLSKIALTAFRDWHGYGICQATADALPEGAWTSIEWNDLADIGWTCLTDEDAAESVAHRVIAATGSEPVVVDLAKSRDFSVVKVLLPPLAMPGDDGGEALRRPGRRLANDAVSSRRTARTGVPVSGLRTVTGLYWTATVLALLWAGYAVMRLRRDRSALVVTSTLCMVSVAAAMGVAAWWPALLGAAPAHPVIAWLMISLGLLATWALLAVLAAATSQTARPLALVAVPLAASAAGGLIQAAAPGAWNWPALASQLSLSACYCAAEGRIVVIAWEFSRRVPVQHLRRGMRAVAAGAAAMLAMILARSAMIISYAAGEHAAGRAATPIAVVQGAAIISIVAGITASAWFPPLSRLARRAWLWSAYWRLRSLRAALRKVIPEVMLPRSPGVRRTIRYRVYRMIVEIRDAELALRAYAPPEVPGRAEAAARSAGLTPDKAAAVAEAAVIATALAARRNGQPPRRAGPPRGAINPAPGNDLRAEAARLIEVSRAFRRSPIIRRIASRAPGLAEQARRQDR